MGHRTSEKVKKKKARNLIRKILVDGHFLFLFTYLFGDIMYHVCGPRVKMNSPELQRAFNKAFCSNRRTAST